MITKMEVVPFQWLPVGVKTFHHPLLNRKRAVIIMAAVKDHRWAFNFPCSIARVARPDARRRFVGNRGIIGDESSRRWRRGDEVDTQPPTHAITNDSDA